jgi:hypothetical protein
LWPSTFCVWSLSHWCALACSVALARLALARRFVPGLRRTGLNSGYHCLNRGTPASTEVPCLNSGYPASTRGTPASTLSPPPWPKRECSSQKTARHPTRSACCSLTWSNELSWQPPWLSGARAQGMRTGCFGSEDAHCVGKECRSQRPLWFISN